MSKGLYWSQLFLGIGLGLMIASMIWLFYPHFFPDYEVQTRDVVYYNRSDLSLGDYQLTLPGDKDYLLPKEYTLTGASLEVTKDLEIGQLLVENSDSKIGEDGLLSEIEIFIHPGETAEDIAYKLLNNGIIQEAEEFLQIVRQKRLDRKLRAGSYLITKETDLYDFIEQLTR